MVLVLVLRLALLLTLLLSLRAFEGVVLPGELAMTEEEKAHGAKMRKVRALFARIDEHGFGAVSAEEVRPTAACACCAATCACACSTNMLTLPI